MGLHTNSITEDACPSSVSVSRRYPIIPLIKLSVHKQHELLLVRRLLTAYEQVTLSQNGSLGVAPFGVVLDIKFVISLTISVSSRIYANGL